MPVNKPEPSCSKHHQLNGFVGDQLFKCFLTNTLIFFAERMRVQKLLTLFQQNVLVNLSL